MMKNMFKTKTELFNTLTGLFIGCLLISNVLASKTFTFWGLVLPTAVIIFPVVYIVNDVMAEIFGFQKAKQIIYTGFMINLLAVICYNIAIILPPPEFAIEGANAFAMTLSSTWRVLIASLVAYIVGSITNSYIMVKMKEKSERNLMLRCILSTLVGEGLDAFFFITIAFIGTMPVTSLLVMIVAQAIFKTLFEVVVFPITNCVIKTLNSLPE